MQAKNRARAAANGTGALRPSEGSQRNTITDHLSGLVPHLPELTRVTELDGAGEDLFVEMCPYMGPLYLRSGDPPRCMKNAAGTPPCGFEFMGTRATVHGYMYPCPCGCGGYVPLKPEGDGYALAREVGCSKSCPSEEVVWSHLWVNMQLPVSTVGEHDRRYARAVVRRLLNELVVRDHADPGEAVRAVAYNVGRWAAAAGLDSERGTLMAAFRKAAIAIGAGIAADAIIAAFTAGTARPARLPA